MGKGVALRAGVPLPWMEELHSLTNEITDNVFAPGSFNEETYGPLRVL